jgi:hypothetical protein
VSCQRGCFIPVGIAKDELWGGKGGESELSS